MTQDILKQAIAHYGDKMQLTVAMEEMAELQKELSKAIRGNPDYSHIAEEIADVEIMVEQLKIIFDCKFQVSSWKHTKLERLRNKIGSE